MQIMETILVEASKSSPQEFDLFCATTCGTSNDIKVLAESASYPLIKGIELLSILSFNFILHFKAMSH
jgi:hypothetical protein